ncbi:hypothetical protein PV10_00321 [Exophiala mesophila]|uniref:Uncharacterized protein n=1 Tax=Exophiala mesophila TaxID=212818 RepID=A0A0D1Y6V2_EXOME|nr:uncharacterized protein PV10_00321 [Exophiala mesophila]KIV96451.1 hypothetical protein PV10_00321 [Exophiala mesophila]
MRLFLGYQPSHCRGAVSPSARLDKTLAQMRARASTAVAKNFVNRISKLKGRFENSLGFVGPESARALEECVSECFSITTSNGRVSFRTTLQNAGLNSHEWFNDKFIMQIDKLGAYYRIPETLSRESRRKGIRSLFSNIKLEYLDPYEPRQSSISLTGKKIYCYVHAEVQMVVHYMITRSTQPPRFIGTSKATCFLCHLFINEQKLFSVSAWHGRLYDQWTIPDLAEYNSVNIAALRAIIRGVQHECVELISQEHLWRPYPLTSRHHLPELPVYSPASTITKLDPPQSTSRSILPAPSRVSPGGVESVFNQSPSASDAPATPTQPKHDLESKAVPECDNTTAPVSQINSLSNLRQRNDSILSTPFPRSFNLHPGKPLYIEYSNFRILVEIQSPCEGILTLKEDSEMDAGSQEINLEHLKERCETSFEKRDSDSSVVLRFRKGIDVVCCVALEWI